MIYQGALYHCHTSASELEEIMQFVVPMAHWVAAMNGYHRDARHQGQQQMLYLLQDQFWWPGMVMQMKKAISNCKWCIQCAGTHAKASMQPIIATAPLELLHIHKYWDDYGDGSTTKCGEHSGFLQPLYETCHGLCHPQSNCKDCC